jgi:hypothetical protein
LRCRYENPKNFAGFDFYSALRSNPNQEFFLKVLRSNTFKKILMVCLIDNWYKIFELEMRLGKKLYELAPSNRRINSLFTTVVVVAERN